MYIHVLETDSPKYTVASLLLCSEPRPLSQASKLRELIALKSQGLDGKFPGCPMLSAYSKTARL